MLCYIYKRDIDIALETLPTAYPHSQNEGSEDNIYNYIVKNVTQPLEIITELSNIRRFNTFHRIELLQHQH